MSKEDLKLIDIAELAGIRRSLIQTRSVDGVDKKLNLKQQQFTDLLIKNDNRSFLEYFDRLHKEENLTVTVDYPVNPLTEKEVTEPPLSTEQANHELLLDVNPRIAALPSFWTSYQVELVRRNLIQPSYLAAKTGGSETGRERIQKASASKRKKQRRRGEALDDCVRTILRQLGGLPEARGKVSLFVDCKLARSWWRGYFVGQVCDDFGREESLVEYREDVWHLLRLTSAPWDELVSYGLRKLTSINYRSVRSAFVEGLLHANMKESKSDQRKNKCQQSIHNIGVLTANQSLGLFTPTEVFEIIQPLIENA